MQVKSLEQQIKATESQIKIAEQQFKANEAQFKAVESQNSILKETQFDRAFTLIDNQKKVYDADMKMINSQIDKLKREAESKVMQLDEINNVFECERRVFVILFIKLNSLKSPADDKKFVSDDKSNFEDLMKTIDVLCVYKAPEATPRP